jgi:SLT domain-containing protein
MAGGIINELFGSHTATGGGGSGTPYTGPLSGGAAQWGPDVAQAAGMLGIPVSVVPGVLNLISHESGGNPNAINLWDSNAAAGHPSQGLMQTIASTFEAYRSASLPDNILDPLANIYAGMNYAMHNYGVGMLMAGGRTDSAGNYIGYDQGGWLQPGFTPVWNGTGAPEPVLNPSQWEGMKGGSGKDGELLAAIRRVETLLEQNPHQVAAGVAGEFQRAAIAHADRSLMNARTR